MMKLYSIPASRKMHNHLSRVIRYKKNKKFDPDLIGMILSKKNIPQYHMIRALNSVKPIFWILLT
jgi:hypothetical protein